MAVSCINAQAGPTTSEAPPLDFTTETRSTRSFHGELCEPPCLGEWTLVIECLKDFSRERRHPCVPGARNAERAGSVRSPGTEPQRSLRVGGEISWLRPGRAVNFRVLRGSVVKEG